MLRPVEERDAKGNTIRVNPAITFKTDRQTRTIIGRHDWRLDDNPNYHPPVTVQVQSGEIKFFEGVPDNSQTRSAAKELKYSNVESVNERGMKFCGQVPKYIVDQIKAVPIKVREPRPTVYEVRLAQLGDVEVTEATEIATDGAGSITVSPIEPNVNPGRQRGAAIEATL